jgi:hypothetical protein
MTLFREHTSITFNFLNAIGGRIRRLAAGEGASFFEHRPVAAALFFIAVALND